MSSEAAACHAHRKRHGIVGRRFEVACSKLEKTSTSKTMREY
jgi:hypothetical protein